MAWCAGDKSKRSHVFEVATVLSLTMLLQDDALQVAAEWFEEVRMSLGFIYIFSETLNSGITSLQLLS